MSSSQFLDEDRVVTENKSLMFRQTLLNMLGARAKGCSVANEHFWYSSHLLD